MSHINSVNAKKHPRIVRPPFRSPNLLMLSVRESRHFGLYALCS